MMLEMELMELEMASVELKEKEQATNQPDGDAVKADGVNRVDAIGAEGGDEVGFFTVLFVGAP
ncbi:hypothetical protein Dimus_024829 [Dionaea muscipula]